jgi:glycosyltransferase involved in cell wall biosynthesis
LTSTARLEAPEEQALNRAFPFVSVIIPVYNDSVRLTKCLHALDRQTYPSDRYEILVIDNGSTQSIDMLVGEHANARAALEPKPGSYAARNKGLSVARGEVIAFTDSDCIPSPQWIAQGVEALLGNKEGGLVGGGIQVFPADPRRATAVELYDLVRGLVQKDYVHSGFAVTANLFTFRHVIETVGPFDAELKSGGDAEWGQRAVARGFRFVYAEAASIAHPARRTLGQIYDKVARVTGGCHQVHQNDPVHVPLRYRLAWSRHEFGTIRTDPRLRSRRERLRALAVQCFVEFVRVFERNRLRLGGKPRR